MGTRFQLNELRVAAEGRFVYEQRFRSGVNIIRGENGSGKSTIADSIFFILGGEFDGWKDAAARCDEVLAEVETPNGIISLKRSMATKQEPIHVFFDKMEEALKSASDGWHRYSLRRSDAMQSFSQVMFKAANIPEAPGDGSSNITMHQLLRLLYSDQQTPVSRLFRFESFDTKATRSAVGSLMCGRNTFEEYQLQLEIREIESKLQGITQEIRTLQKGFPESVPVENLNDVITSLEAQKRQLATEIANADELVDDQHSSQFMSERKKAIDKYRRLAKNLREVEQQTEEIELELEDLDRFLTYLEEIETKLDSDETVAQIVGQIEFEYCPACLQKLHPNADEATCNLCGSHLAEESGDSRYLSLKLDIRSQLNDSRRLRQSKEASLRDKISTRRRLRTDTKNQLGTIEDTYDVSSSPREVFLSEKNREIGRIDQEVRQLENYQSLLSDLNNLIEERTILDSTLTEKRDRHAYLSGLSRGLETEIKLKISEEGTAFLRADLPRQQEFIDAQRLVLDYEDDAIFVDEHLRFAESSNVILKNTAFLSMLFAAVEDGRMFHPKFLLLDNVEDKGMEVERNHNFQNLIAERGNQLDADFQIIFTTSEIAPELEGSDLTIGPHYTHDERTLDFG